MATTTENLWPTEVEGHLAEGMRGMSLGWLRIRIQIRIWVGFWLGAVRGVQVAPRGCTHSVGGLLCLYGKLGLHKKKPKGFSS